MSEDIRASAIAKVGNRLDGTDVQGTNTKNHTHNPPDNAASPCTAFNRGHKSVRWLDEENPGSDIATIAFIPSTPITNPDTLDLQRDCQVIAEGLPPSVRTILNTMIDVNGGESTLEKICRDATLLYGDRPSDIVIQQVEARLGAHVSVDDQRRLFDHLGWEFTCVSCGMRWPAKDFCSSAEFKLTDGEGRGLMQSGPCGICSSTCASQV